MNWWEQLEGPLLGRYRIERVLGEGGMARVFVATDLKFNRQVAIKTPKLESFPPDRVAELLKRFNREFRSQAEDPIHGVVPVYDAGEVIDAHGLGRPILVMQFLTGGSLAQRLGGRVGAREHLQTLSEVLEWLLPVATALDAVHQRRFLHRDVKPDNILFNRDGQPFLADFGVVGMLDTDMGLDASTLGPGPTGAAQVPGSPGYQPPESLRDGGVAGRTPASDQFSLAITVYEALSGALPMQVGSTAEWYGALMHWAPTPLSQHCPELPRAAADAVMKAMSLQTSDRFLSCSEFAKVIAGAVATYAASTAPRPAAVKTEPPPTPVTPRPRRGRGIVAALLVAGAILAIVLLFRDKFSGLADPASTADTTPPAVADDRQLSEAIGAWVREADAAESARSVATIDIASSVDDDSAAAFTRVSNSSTLHMQHVATAERAAGRVLELVLARPPQEQQRLRLLLLALKSKEDLHKRDLEQPMFVAAGWPGRGKGPAEQQAFALARAAAIALNEPNVSRLEAATTRALAVDAVPDTMHALHEQVRARGPFAYRYKGRAEMVVDGEFSRLGHCDLDYRLTAGTSVEGESLDMMWQRECADLDRTEGLRGSLRFTAAGPQGQVVAAFVNAARTCRRKDGSDCTATLAFSSAQEEKVLISLVTPDVIVIGRWVNEGQPLSFDILLKAADAGTARASSSEPSAKSARKS